MKLIMIALILLATISSFVFADEQSDIAERDYLFIIPSSFNFLSELEVNNINKTILRISSQQNTYQLALSNETDFTKLTKKAHSLNAQIVQKSGLYDISVRLMDLVKNEKIREVGKKDVRREEIQKVVEQLTLQMFEQVEQARVSEKKDKKKLAKAPLSKFDNGLKAFKQRILTIKLNIEKQLKAIQENPKKELKQQESSQDESNSKKKKTEATDSPTSSINKSQKKDDIVKEKEELIRLESFALIGVGFWSNDIQSEYIVNTNTYVPQLSYEFKKGFFFDESSRFYHLYTVRLGQLASSYEIEIEPSNLFQAGVGYKNDHYRFQLETHFSYHTLSYGNLSSTGAGIVPANHVNYWFDVYFGIRGTIKDIPFKISALYGQLIMGTINFPNIDANSLTGTRYGLDMMLVNIWKNFSLSMGIYQMQMQSTTIQDVIIEQNVFNQFFANNFAFNLGTFYTF